MINLVETDISQESLALAIVGGFVVIYGLVSHFAKERLFLSEPLLALTVGIIVGPAVLSWVNVFTWGGENTYAELTYQFTRIVVGVQVLFAGIALPEKYLWRQKWSLVVMLANVMTVAWLVSSLFIWALVKDITYLEALCIGACITPTDPVLANTITSGEYAEKHVPVHVRHLILAESGANDGLGFPFLFLAVFLMARTRADYGESVGDEIWRWFYSVVVYEVLLSCVYGAVIGYLARKALQLAARQRLVDMSNFFSYGFCLALFTLGTGGLFGTDDILACFVAGNAFTWDDWFRLRAEENDFQEILDMLLNAAIFMYIGMIIPWADYSDAAIGLSGWRIVLIGICIMLCRRLPWILSLHKAIPAIRNWREAMFIGWFGPIGVSAVYYIEVAIRKVPDDHTRDRLRRVVSPVVLFCVFSSVLVHGISIPIIYFGPKFASGWRADGTYALSLIRQFRSKLSGGKGGTKGAKPHSHAHPQVFDLPRRPFSRGADGVVLPDHGCESPSDKDIESAVLSSESPVPIAPPPVVLSAPADVQPRAAPRGGRFAMY
ncbi:hypothetical protein MSPP1_002738 [Malassezia sp. CBS 17886]|nr:hypothetical protein MSPP1_002738 [Malassezia sp. CBS 17886]